MMKILAHRGHWITPLEKNALVAFERALQGGFGIETDLRDAQGGIVISHDMPRGGEMSLDDFLALCAAHPAARPLALNVKADGMQALVRDALAAHRISDAYVFDMAVPDTLGYLAQGVPTYVRCSEYESPEPLLARAEGIWLDAFQGEWYTPDDILGWLNRDKAVCLVSPELHKRPHLAFWSQLRDSGLHRHALLSLCTDFPTDAKEFFRVQD